MDEDHEDDNDDIGQENKPAKKRVKATHRLPQLLTSSAEMIAGH